MFFQRPAHLSCYRIHFIQGVGDIHLLLFQLLLVGTDGAQHVFQLLRLVGMGIVQLHRRFDLRQGKSEPLSPQDQFQADQIAFAVNPFVFFPPGRQQLLGFIKPDGSWGKSEMSG